MINKFLRGIRNHRWHVYIVLWWTSQCCAPENSLYIVNIIFEQFIHINLNCWVNNTGSVAPYTFPKIDFLEINFKYQSKYVDCLFNLIILSSRFFERLFMEDEINFELVDTELFFFSSFQNAYFMGLHLNYWNNDTYFEQNKCFPILVCFYCVWITGEKIYFDL